MRTTTIREKGAAKDKGRAASGSPGGPAPGGAPGILWSRLATGDLIQPKLTVGAPGDRWEREADEVADRVLRMPDPGAPGTVAGAPPSIQRIGAGGGVRRAAAPSPDLEEDLVQATAAPGAVPAVTPGAEARIGGLRGGGSPLAPELRAYFEPRFGRDLSGVRLHTAGGADAAAHSISARAFTVGSDVGFAAGEYRPETPEGRRLLAHELVHTIQQGSAGAGSGRVQRAPKKEETFFRFTVVPQAPLTAQQFRAFAARTIFGVGEDQAAHYAASFNWTGPHSTGGVTAADVGKPLIVKVSAGLYRQLKGVATPAGEGVDEATARAEGFAGRAAEADRLPAAEKKAIYDEVDERFWDRTGYKRGRRLGDSDQDRAMAQLWLDIRDEAMIERQKLAGLPANVRQILGAASRGPEDWTQLVRIAETLSESEWADYASRVTARTPSLDALEAAVRAFREANRKREKDVARRKELQRKLYGTESLYAAYQDYLEKQSAAAGSWQSGAGDNVVWVEASPAEKAAAQSAEKSLTGRLVAAGFPGGIPEYQTALREIVKAFETETVHIGITALDRYESFLWKQGETYQSDAVISALWDRLAPLRAEYVEFARHKRVAEESSAAYERQSQQRRTPGSGHVQVDPKLKAAAEEAYAKASAHKAQAAAHVQALTGDHPIFSEAHLPLNRRIDKQALAQADKPGLKKLLADHIAARTEDVKKTRDNLRDDPELIYKMDQLLGEAYRQMEIQPGSLVDTLIKDRARQIARDEALVQFFLAVLAIAFTILTFGTGAVVVVGAAGALATGGIAAYEEFERYRIASAAAGSGLSSKEPSPAWLVLAVVGVVFDAALALKAVTALAPAARALEATGDLVAFQRTVQALEKSAQIDAKIARAAEAAARSRQAAEAAGLAFRKAITGKAYSFPGPLTDPEVYKHVVQWAYHRARQGLSSLHEFILELNKARVAEGLAEMSEAELALAKRAAAEGFEAAQVGTYTTRIQWGVRTIDVRPHSAGGFWGKRTPQKNPLVDAYERKINPADESYYLPHPNGGYVQFENLASTTLQDGKRVIQARSQYHVADMPSFAREGVLAEAKRQVEAAGPAGLSVEWLVSEQRAATQIQDLFTAEGIPIRVTLLPP